MNGAGIILVFGIFISAIIIVITLLMKMKKATIIFIIIHFIVFVKINNL